MTQQISSRPLRARRTIVTLAAGLVLIFSSCEQNPAIPLSPGQPWSFELASIDSLVVTPIARRPSYGNSRTLFAGVVPDPEPRETGILLKFAGLDTARLNNMEGARLVLFRRAFTDSTPDPMATFDFYVVEALDTSWTESDTGLTINDFPLSPAYATTQLTEDSVFIFTADTLVKDTPEHLKIPVDTLLLRQWSTGLLANNGFLVLMNGGDRVIGFHARNTPLFPYLAIDLHDTTSAGVDTTIIEYRSPTADLSIYPVPAQGGDRSLIQLNHSKGLGLFIDSLIIVTNNPIVGGRLILHTQADAPQLVADQMKIDLLWHTDSLGVGDRMASAVFQAGSDSLIMNVGAVVLRYANGFDLYGLELVVDPQHNDFDNLSFWGSAAADKLMKPRLEIISSFPYGEEID